MKVSIVVALSLDGKIAQSSDQVSLEWTSKEDKRFFVTKTKEAGVLLMGRKTYETIGRPLPGREMVVLTRHPDAFENLEGVTFSSEALPKLVAQFEADGREEIVIAGGAEIYRQAFKTGIVTDVYATVEPVIFGGGVPFVEQAFIPKMSLHQMEKLGENTVLLHYTL